MNQADSVPGGRELGYALEQMRSMHSQLVEMSQWLRDRCDASMTDATDGEIAYHELWLRQMRELSKDLDERLGKLAEINAQRAANILLSRSSEGFLAFDHRFRLDGDMLPSAPKKGTDEYAQLLEWIQGTEYAGLVAPKIEWPALKALCNELAEKGQPPPPNVKLYPKFKLVISKL